VCVRAGRHLCVLGRTSAGVGCRGVCARTASSGAGAAGEAEVGRHVCPPMLCIERLIEQSLHSLYGVVVDLLVN